MKYPIAENRNKDCHPHIGLNFKSYPLQIVIFRKSNYKVLWCCRRIEKISRTDLVKNEEVLHRVKDLRNILNTIERRTAKRIGRVLHRNCLLIHVIEGKMERKNKGREGEEEDVPRYWMALKNREDTGN